MNKHDEIIDEIHRIRAEIAEEYSGLSPEERAAKMNRDAAEIMRKFNLKLPVRQRDKVLN